VASWRSLLQGFAAGEVSNIILKPHLRSAIWLLILGGLAAILCCMQMEDRASGTFQVRSAVRAELRAPVAGFLRDVYGDEGDRVSAGAVVVRMEIPELASRLTQKRAEVCESQAKLRLLEAGTRAEEVAEQRQRVVRAKAWFGLAKQDLGQKQKALGEDLDRLDKQVIACRAELDAAQAAYDRDRDLLARHAIARQEFVEAEKKCLVLRARFDQAQAEKRARQAHGVLEAKAEVARREKDW